MRVLVTSDVPAENIQRLARSQGWTPVVERQGAEIVLTLTRESPRGGAVRAADATAARGRRLPDRELWC